MEPIVREAPLIAYIAPALQGLVFITLMSLVKEPLRRQINVVIAGGFATIYVNGGFGPWEFVYMATAIVPAVLGHRSYRYIGIAWLMHTFWDLAHHFYGNPLWAFDELSSLGCAVMDAVVAVWFFMDAPSVFSLLSRRNDAAPVA
ncbi:MAG: DUF6010 family protein [bacterium]|nr:DUF6010 family protein [bacterium]